MTKVFFILAACSLSLVLVGAFVYFLISASIDETYPSGSQANRKDHSGTALTFRARRFRLLPTDAPRVGVSSSMLEAKSLD